MSEKVDAGSFADFLLLGSTYDRKARLAPGLILTLPVTVALMFAAGSGALTAWYETLAVGVVAQLSLTVVFGYLAHSMGSGTEYLHMTDPHGPLISFLCTPSPESANHGSKRKHSPEQKQAWRQAAYAITGVDLCARRFMSPDPAFDAYKRLIVNICGQSDGSTCMAGAHGEEYGFARNLVAVTPLWMLLSGVGLLVVAYIVAFEHVLAGWIGVAFELLFLAAAVLVYWNGREFINTTGERFVESLLDQAEEKMKPQKTHNPRTPAEKTALQDTCPEVASAKCSAWRRKTRDLAPGWRAVYPGFIAGMLVVTLGVGGRLHAQPALVEDQAEAWAQRELRSMGVQPDGDMPTVRTIPVDAETAIAEKERLYSLTSTVVTDTALEMLAKSDDYDYRFYFSYRSFFGKTSTPSSQGVIAVYKHDEAEPGWRSEVYSAEATDITR